MDIQQLSDRFEIEDLLNKMSWYQDRRAWDALQEVLDEQVLIGYPAAYGGKTDIVSAAEQVQRWRTPLEALDASQHVLSGILVTLAGDQANVTANELGWMRRDAAQGSNLWYFGGTLDLKLARTAKGWRITALIQTPTWVQGNFGVFPSPENIV